MRSKFREADYKFYTWMVLSLGLTIIALGLVGCGKTAPSEKTNVYSFETPKQLSDAVQNFTVECKGDCPQSSGVLLAIEKASLQLHTCTFSLVAKDIILTNLHCLPDSVAKAGASCEGTLQAVFAKDGTKEVFHCAKVLSVAEKQAKGDDYGRDYAFIKLTSPSERRPLRLNTGGLADGELLTALVATPMKSNTKNSKTKRGSILHEVRCKAHMNSYVSKGFTHSLSPVAAFKDCNIVHGNSGAAMVNAAGEIKAVAQTSWMTDNDTANPITLSDQLALVQQTHKFIVATNAACLNNADLDLSSARNGCVESPVKYKPTLLTAGYDQQLETEKHQAILQSLANAVPSVRFRIRTFVPTAQESSRGVVTTVQTVPECVKSLSAPVKYQSQKIQYVREIDEDARLQVRARVETEEVTLTLKNQKAAGVDGSLSENVLVSEVSHSGQGPRSGVKKKSYLLKSCAQ